MDFANLPDDVLHLIFAFLPLKIILQMECVCTRLKSSTASYLSTLKSINLFNYSVREDLFRHWNNQVSLSPSQLLICLKRCPRARCITYLPGPAQKHGKAYCSEICSVVKQHPNITTINFLDSRELLDEFRAHKVPITFGEVRIVPWNGSISLISRLQVSSFSFTNVLYIEDTTLDPKILELFWLCYEMSFIRCLFTHDLEDSLKELTLPNIQKFVYVEEPGNSASSQIFSRLVSHVVKSDKLKTFHVGLNRFSMLDGIATNWLATNLQDLEINSTGSSYSNALQQLRYAPIVAEICQKCRGSLQRMCLPSTILVKQFFDRLISCGCYFPHMKTLEMTGIADTKMFLVPGNAVEALYYQEFIKLCPQIKSLSLHSFSGSLNNLTLPITISSLDLPWDNRLNLEMQKNLIESCASFLPNLQSLSILGVEEIEAMLQLTQNSQVSMVLALESLLELKIKNACLKNLDLTNCTNLSRFSMHCCPTSVSLPVKSVETVYIYTSDPIQLEVFMRSFLLAKASVRMQNQVACHIHAQLQSISEQEGSLPVMQNEKTQKLFEILKSTCFNLSENLDFWVLKDRVQHVFEHNSGETMYPFTEYTSHSNTASGRSKVDVLVESSSKDRILEGIHRWKSCICQVESIVTSTYSSSPCSVAFDTIFCDRPFKCLTNLSYLPVLNINGDICQASGDNTDWSSATGNTGEKDFNMAGDKKGMFTNHHLNIPRLQPRVNKKDFIIPECIACTNKPLVFISIIEYSHHIHTLFYYD